MQNLRPEFPVLGKFMGIIIETLSTYNLLGLEICSLFVEKLQLSTPNLFNLRRRCRLSSFYT